VLRRPFSRRQWIALALAAIVVLGGGLRARAAAEHDPTLSTDERGYVREAFKLSEGTYRSFHWPPGAPAMFAASRVIVNERDLPAAYWLQALVGTLLIAVCFAIAALAAGPLAGLTAAALVALYPPFVTLSGSLQSEPLGALLIAMAILAVTWALLRDGRLRWWALAGLLFGATVLTRTDLILGPFIVAALAALALFRRGDAHSTQPRSAMLRSAALPAAVLVGAFVLCLAPWTVYASYRTGEFTPVTEGDASALFVGTYLPGDGTTQGMKSELGARVRASDRGLRGIPNGKLKASDVLDFVAERRPGLPRDEALRVEARENLRRYALGQPLEFVQMMAAKVSRTWFLSSRAGSPNKSDFTRAYHVVLVLACLALMLAVAVMRRSALVGMCLALIAYSMLLHAVFVAKPRYNLPLMSLLIVGGVVAACILLQRRSALTAPTGGAPIQRASSQELRPRPDAVTPDEEPDPTSR